MNKFDQGGENLYNENYKTLWQEIEEDTNKWRISYVHRLKELILLTCAYYPKPCVDSTKSL